MVLNRNKLVTKLNFQKEIDEITLKSFNEIKKAAMYNRTQTDRLKAIGNIYFIYSNGILKYIGQRQSKGIKTRLDQHLFGKSFSLDEKNVQNGTISKWHKVKEEIDNKNKITFKTILIEPDNLRTTIELELIRKLAPEWNIQGK